MEDRYVCRIDLSQRIGWRSHRNSLERNGSTRHPRIGAEDGSTWHACGTCVVEAADMEVPPRRALLPITFAAEMVSNTAYYSLVGLARPENALAAGAALGLAAGIGAVILPGPLGLGEEPSSRSPETKLLTVAWYLAGGVVAGLLRQSQGNAKKVREDEPFRVRNE